MTRRLSGMAAGPSVLCALGFASVLVTFAERAAAHDPPSGSGVYARTDTLVVRTERGLIVSSSPERRDLRLLCNEALGVADFDAPSVLLQEDGSMLVGTSAGLMHVSRDLCAIDAMPALTGTRISALLRPSDVSEDVYAATEAGFFTSSDGGRTFSAQDPNVFDSLQLAEAGVVYATGRYPGPQAQRRVYVARWHKGEPLEQHELALEATEAGVALLGSDHGHVFAVARAFLGTEYSDRFLISSDGARTWTSPFSAAGISALTPDRESDAWLVGAASGLWRATPDAQPVRVRDGAISCLAPLPPGLYACDGSGSQGCLSLSADGGATWTSVFRFDQVAGLGECPMASKAVEQCQAAWADWTREMSPALAPAEADAGAANGDAALGRDAGAPHHAAEDATPIEQRSLPPSDNGCAAVGGIRSHAKYTWPVLLVAALRMRRRRAAYPAPVLSTEPQTHHRSFACAQHQSAAARLLSRARQSSNQSKHA